METTERYGASGVFLVGTDRGPGRGHGVDDIGARVGKNLPGFGEDQVSPLFARQRDTDLTLEQRNLLRDGRGGDGQGFCDGFDAA